MSIDMSQFYQVFFDETAEHLAAMESLLLGLDIETPDLDDLNAIFRAAHSIKGGSGTFGFTDMTAVTHVLETLLDRLRKAELQVTDEMVDTFLQAGDVLKAQLNGHQSGGAEADQQAVDDVCAQLERLARDAVTAVAPAASAAPQQATPEGAEQAYEVRIEYAPSSDRTGPQTLLDALGALGRAEVVAGADAAADALVMKLATAAGEDEIRDTLAFFVQPEQVSIAAVNAAAAQAEDAGYGFFDDVAAPQAEAAEDDGYGFFVDPDEIKAQVEDAQGYGLFEDALSHQPAELVTNIEIESPTRSDGRRTTVDDPNVAVAKVGRRDHDKVAVAASSADTSSIRVSTEKVDQLINLVGELVITQAMLAQTASGVDPVLYEALLNGMAQLDRNTRDLQESVMSIRMMPISFVFSRFPRVVRDLAGKLGKQVELKTIGEGTELDKGLIEKIADPLTHLVRNSLDHGVELPERRLAAGKDAKGTITLRASHRGGNIVIEVGDDGAGLNREKILSKAHERGLAVGDHMSDQEVWQLIFAPGFSTADVVTDVSGRGVGMDVVKRNIEGMGGRVEIESETGYGSKITIRLPLTLAILDGMSVAVGEEIFILPLTYIIESLQPPKDDVKTVSGQGRVVQVRGEYLPLVALHEAFNMTPKVAEPHQGILVILESDGSKVALFVDELVGQHQVVIKSLESNYRRVPAVSGATIMGDGKVALILDVAALVRLNRH
jgi:two-component system chemotaxis sensor kinase CheA